MKVCVLGGDEAPAAAVERCVSSLFLGHIPSGLLRWRHDNKPTADPPEMAAHLSVSAFKDHGEGSVADQVVAAELEPPNRFHVAAAGGTLVQGDETRLLRPAVWSCSWRLWNCSWSGSGRIRGLLHRPRAAFLTSCRPPCSCSLGSSCGSRRFPWLYRHLLLLLLASELYRSTLSRSLHGFVYVQLVAFGPFGVSRSPVVRVRRALVSASPAVTSSPSTRRRHSPEVVIL